jgi:hypothetical protein
MVKKLNKELSDQDIIQRTKDTLENYYSGYLTVGEFGYKYYPKKMMDIIYLYAHTVDTKNPDLLGLTNRNTQRNPIQNIERKWQQQTNIDLKDINFLLNGASPMARFIPKAANRKILKDNKFSKRIDLVNEYAIRYGSSFLKTWLGENEELKMKEIEPYALAFNIENFAKGLKIERIKKTPREISEETSYIKEATNKLLMTVEDKYWDEDMLLLQVVQDFSDGTQSIYILSTEHELVFYKYTTKVGQEKIISYEKNDFIKREGFEDAPGIGLYELVFNELVQSKVNYERLDRVMELVTKIVYQKQVDGEVDNVAGKSVIKFKDGVVIGHAGNKLERVDVGGTNQITMIRNELNELMSSFPNSLNMSDALLGNVLPAGSSGEYASLLAENSSSVLKEYQKEFTNFIDGVYKDRVIPYMLDVLENDDDLQKYLSPNDYKLVKRGVKNYLLVQEQINAVLENREYDPVLAERNVERQLKKKTIVPGDLLDKLREEWEGIETYISFENVSKGQILAFLNKIEQLYLNNPQALQDPFIRENLLKQAEYDAGMSVLEIEELLETLPQPQNETGA